MNVSIRQADWLTDKDLLRSVRTQVFVAEQSVPIELEWDDLDEQAHHWLAIDNQGKPLGTVRMLADGHIGRMAVLAEYRKQGIGEKLLGTAINHAKHLNLYEVYLHAQLAVIDFYRQQGFTTYGTEFMQAGISHQSMRLQLSDTRQLGIHGGNFSAKHLREVAEVLIGQARQHLRILSYNLDPDTFDTTTMAEYISRLARKSRYTEVRILLVDPSIAIKRGHRLVTLQRKLSSSIHMRKPLCEPYEIKENLILVDQCAIICQSVKEPETIWANFNNKPIAQNYIVQFDELWERSQEDKDLRQLEI
jgi:predicted GNAT family N-acyltransferase